MSDAGTQESAVFLSRLPAGAADRRLAGAVVAASTLVFLVLAPVAKTPLPPLPAFIPIYQSAQVINDLITAIFLIGQSRFARAPSLCVLAGGYLFTSLMAATHALTFPGMFSPTGLLGAGPQTTAWLYMFWHGGFPLFVIAYARRGFETPYWRAASATMLIATLVLVAACTIAATAGQDLLPAIMRGDYYTPTMILVVSGVWLLSLGALIALSRRRPYSLLDLWLMVTVCAWLFDIALSAVLNGGRYDVGFYAGRIYGFLAASFVLVILLVENAELYMQLVALRESDRAKTIELERLSTADALTGIANRRAFDEALDQEWRRMMRHKTPLSLLLIDVDYFKRFNDSYGHVAGDNCLRAVAQLLARRARRAGELAARYGGEEFAVLLPHAEIDEAARLAEVMCTAVRDAQIPHGESDVPACVTVSIGVASVGGLPTPAGPLFRDSAPAASGAIMLIEAADSALYRAKTAGRNRVAVAGRGASAQAAA